MSITDDQLDDLASALIPILDAISEPEPVPALPCRNCVTRPGDYARRLCATCYHQEYRARRKHPTHTMENT